MGQEKDGALRALEQDTTLGRPRAPAEPDPRGNRWLRSGILGKLDVFPKGLLLGRLPPALASMQQAKLCSHSPDAPQAARAVLGSRHHPKPQRGAQPLITPQIAVPGTTAALPGRILTAVA